MFRHFLSITSLLLCIFYTFAEEKELKRAEEAYGIVMLDSFTYPILVNEYSNQSTFVLVMNKKDLGEYGSDTNRNENCPVRIMV